jgi:prevent-host-death family protein
MKTVTIHEAKTHLSRLIREALTGEEIIIARGKEPLVKITPLTYAIQEREFGCAEGTVEYIADDFDAPLDDFQDYTK